MNRLRLGYYLARGDMRGMAWWLRRSLSVEDRRRMAFMLLRDEQVVASFQAAGFDWEMPVGDEIARETFATGSYQGDGIRALIKRFPPGLLLEIGANIGTTTLPFARAGWDVVAIEPVPGLYRHLCVNVERNGLSERVTCVNAAIGKETGEAEMVVPDGMYGSSYLDGYGHFDGGGTKVRVSTTTVEAIVARCGEPSLVWCDAEGAEPLAIESGADLWARGVPLYVELMSSSLPVAHAHFRRFALANGRFRPIEELAIDGIEDVLLST